MASRSPLSANLRSSAQLFGLRRYPIYWSINSNLFRVRGYGPVFQRFSPDFAAFGADARDAAKLGGGTLRFWFLMIISSLYFSGLIHEVRLHVPFPWAQSRRSRARLARDFDSIMSTLGKCFNKTYLPDLILRHVSSSEKPSRSRRPIHADLFSGEPAVTRASISKPPPAKVRG